jgi:hypothetical protein
MPTLARRPVPLGETAPGAGSGWDAPQWLQTWRPLRILSDLLVAPQ